MGFPLWQREFGARAGVPDGITCDARLIDISWHNDICPSFVVAGCGDDVDEELPRLWVDFERADDRETPSAPRFMVSCGNGDEAIFESETDAAGAVAALLAASLRGGEGL
jgi:hypothetical protein